MNRSAPAVIAFGPDKRDRRLQLYAISAMNAGLSPKVVRCSSTLDKLRALSEAVRVLPNDALIVATDSFDVLCLTPTFEIGEAFGRYSKRIVFAGERGCFHHLESSRKFFEERGDGVYKYLNSGVIVGDAGAVKQMVETVASWDHEALQREFSSNPRNVGSFNDQTLWGLYASANSTIVGLDYNAAFCWTVAGEYDELNAALHKSSFDFTNPQTDLVPAFLHVTQVRKYYPLYLCAAMKLGLPLNGHTADIELFDQHLTKTVTNIDEHVVEMDQPVQSALKSTIAYRRLKARQAFVARLKRLRMGFGRTRRSLFRTAPR